MSTITAILEPDPEGCVHLALPSEMRTGKVKVTATSTVDSSSIQSARPLDALRRIAGRGGLPGISDPVAWQCEIRQDRPLPGR